jgi:hypothetical protein
MADDAFEDLRDLVDPDTWFPDENEPDCFEACIQGQPIGTLREISEQIEAASKADPSENLFKSLGLTGEQLGHIRDAFLRSNWTGTIALPLKRVNLPVKQFHAMLAAERELTRLMLGLMDSLSDSSHEVEQ